MCMWQIKFDLIWSEKLGTTKTLPRAGRPGKLSNRGRRAVTKNPMVTLTELQSSSVEMGEPSRRTLQHSTNQAFMVEWPDGRHSSVKRHMTVHLEWRTLRPWEKIFSSLMKPRLNSLAWMPSVTSGGDLAPFLWRSMVVAGSCCVDVFQRQGQGD